LATCFACGGDGGAPPAAKADEDAAAAQDEPVADADPLLAEARAALNGGKLPPRLEQRILDSDDPAHARARRLLATMKRQQSGAQQEAAPAVSPAQESATPVTAPPEGDGGEAEKPEAASNDASNEHDESPPKLTVLTRLALVQKGSGAVLTVHAAAELKVGLAQQSKTARLVVESAGALPAFLQARPSLDGIRIIDVRRGQDTVQIAIELDDGWKVGRPEGFSGGARLRFTAP
jgi:hypothetical protein